MSVSVQEKLELKIIDSNDIGHFYKYVNKHSVHKTGIGPLKSETGTLVLDDAQKAELLNAYFVSVCTIDNGILPPLPDPSTDPVNEQLDDITFTTAQVLRLLKNVKNKTSAGPDGLPPIIFRKLAPKLARPLTIIFNLIMQFGEVPEVWKKATVVPIFKKGVSSNPQNYRPISLTCVGSKIFESAIKT